MRTVSEKSASSIDDTPTTIGVTLCKNKEQKFFILGLTPFSVDFTHPWITRTMTQG